MNDWLNTITLGEVVLLASVVIAVVGTIWKVFPWLRQVVHFMDDITGEAARRGYPGRPGLLERQAKLEDAVADIQHAVQELRPNHGSSVKDQLSRIEAAQMILADRLAQHVEAHK